MLSGTGCDSWEWPCAGQGVDSMILVGPFQVSVFSESVTCAVLQHTINIPLLTGCWEAELAYV